jgi:putative DNA primase/helicase
MRDEATEKERARAALSHLSPDVDRDTWVKFGMCVKHEFGDDGFEIWDEWSAKGSNYTASHAKSAWKSIKADGGRTISTLFFEAKAAGWKDTSARKVPTKAEIEARKAAAAERARQAAEQEAAQHARAAEQAQAIWDAATPCEAHPYLERKGVPAHGLRVGRWEVVRESTGDVVMVSDTALLIPIRDRQRKIWSLQAIFPNAKNTLRRDKDYLAGGAKAGNFFPVGGKPLQRDGKPVFVLGEGYATCASVHAATGHLVLVCFDTSNLLRVAQALRDAQPEAVIVFAADNDTQTEGNPGVTVARRAAKAVGGLVAAPAPGDFNDLHLAAGLDAVREAIDAAAEPVDPPPPPDEPPPWEDSPDDVGTEAMAAPLPAPVEDDGEGRPDQNGYFAILGYNRGTYYIFQHGKRQIGEITKGDMGEVGLIELAPLNWWELNFPGEKSKIDTRAAAEFLIRTAERRGIYDPSNLRGRGAWTDEGRMIYHHGGYLSVDGQPCDVTKIKSRYVYELDRSLPPPADTMLESSEGELLLNLASEFRWSKPGSAALLAGWVALAPVCGALKWRPHIWLTGGAGCGKSTVLNRYVHHLLGGLDLYAQGNSSEAGIRQTLRADARPVLFDESESNEESDARRMQNVLSLIRQSSTESEAQTLKGTAGGAAMSFLIRSMFCLASIQVALKQQADVDRLTVLTLRPKRDDKDAEGTWRRISDGLYAMERDDTIPARLFRRSMDLLPITLQNIKVFSSAAAKRFNNQRDGDQFGTMLAGAWSLISTRVAKPEEALELIDRYDWSEHRDNADADEGQRALSSLMEAHVRIKGGIEVTVYELVCAAFGSPTEMTDLTQATADAILQRHGMKVRGDRLLLSNNSNELRRLMSGSPYEADYRGVLLRVTGADRNDNKPVKFSGVQNKCISIPLGPIVTGDAREPAF